MDIYNDVLLRVKNLGYTATEDDEESVRYSIGRASEYITGYINRAEVPEGLKYTFIDMAAGLFLTDKKAAGTLGDGFDFSAPVKSKSEGDVSITFASASDGSKTPEARFDEMLLRMVTPAPSLLISYRRMRW